MEQEKQTLIDWKILKEEKPTDKEEGNYLVFLYEKEKFACCTFEKKEEDFFWVKKTKANTGTVMNAHLEDRWIKIPKIKVMKQF